MEEEIVDYSSDSMDTTPIWTDDPPQRLTRQSPKNPRETDDQAGAFITNMEDEVSTLNDLGFVQPTLQQLWLSYIIYKTTSLNRYSRYRLLPSYTIRNMNRLHIKHLDLDKHLWQLGVYSITKQLHLASRT